ncbi:alpha/beta fold hydrolase [Kribbella sp. NPDC051770]|uniref:alpha/beta hydrolase n=1 Tax=Kribbella sp. NPDC051770 TaxID=3155413 RepID=UPI00342CA327
MSAPGIDLVAAPRGARDLVLLAHGGMENSTADPHSWRAPILRMWPFAAVARKAAPGVAVGLMRYRYQGWNGAAADAAADLRTVLDRLVSGPPRFDRVILIGHSMGGRAVVAAGNHSLVSGVLGLAPWLPEGEPLVRLRGPVAFAHGSADRITSPHGTAAYTKRLRAEGIPVALLTLPGEKHAMLHRAPDWNRIVRDFVTHTVNGTESTGMSFTTADHTDEVPHPHSGDAAPAAIADIARTRLTLRVTERL